MGRKKTSDEPAKADRHQNKNISCRPPAALREAVEEQARKERRTPSQMILILIEDAMAARGLWPPPGV